jgi:hypothetical protein
MTSLRTFQTEIEEIQYREALKQKQQTERLRDHEPKKAPTKIPLERSKEKTARKSSSNTDEAAHKKELLVKAAEGKHDAGSSATLATFDEAELVAVEERIQVCH